MALIPPLGLMFRAYAFKQTSATVKLASRHYSDARYRAALTAIHNSEKKLARKYWSGKASTEEMVLGAARLGKLEATLSNRNPPRMTTGRGNSTLLPPDNTLVARLLKIRALQPSRPYAPAVAALQGILVRNDHHGRYDRTMLAHDFWASDMLDAGILKQRVAELARHELRASPEQYAAGAELKRISELAGFIAARKPISPPTDDYPTQDWSLRSLKTSILQRQGDQTELLPHRPARFAAHADGVAAAFWEGRIHDFDSLASQVERAVASALRGAPAGDPATEALRCQLTFEMIVYIEQQQRPEATVLRRTWAEHAERLERDAAQRLLGANQLPPSEGPTVVPGVPGAAPAARFYRSIDAPILDSFDDRALKSPASTLSSSGIGTDEFSMSNPELNAWHAAKDPVAFDAVNNGMRWLRADRSGSTSSGASSAEGFFI